MDPYKFTYKVKSYDAEQKLLDVEFDGDPNRWARIVLMSFMPTNRADLDKLVASFAPKTEQVLVLDADDYFIKEVVGTTHEADRASFAPSPVPSPAPPADTTNAVAASDEEWAEAVVLRVLREKGLIPPEEVPS